MPIPATYPGVYVEEIPSGVRTIIGVPTSVTAFIGRAPRGKENDPIKIRNWGDYTREFGGLAVDSTMSYAVRDFYLNGGSDALIIRVAPTDAKYASIVLHDKKGGNFTLQAISRGEWGNNLRAAVDHKTKVSAATLFNLTVQEIRKEEKDTQVVATETFLNVSTEKDNARYVTRVLEKESTLVTVASSDPLERPEPTITSESVPSSSVPKSKIDWVDADGKGKDGGDLDDDAYIGDTHEQNKTGIYALLKADIFNLLCIPPPVRDDDTSKEIYGAAVKLCRDERAMLLVDPPGGWDATSSTAVSKAENGRGDLGISGLYMRNAALYFPRLQESDPLHDGQIENFVPCGAVAGVFATTDANRGVWKAPAGIEAGLNGVSSLTVKLTDGENGSLNPLGINCLRTFPVIGNVVWGARTMRGADILADEWKYVPVRRFALYLEETLYRGTQWVVFEPNDEPLWAQIRLNIGSFMHDLFRQGAFQGKSPREAYLVKCDKETTTQSDINAGIVNILVGFAPLKPAEFVYIKIQQLAGQIQA